MKNLKNNTEKLCSFYVSEWHLVTMILPYINKELNEEANIITILENNIEDNIKTLMTKLNLKNEKEILNIDWKNNQEMKYSEISKKLQKIVEEKSKNAIVFINGSKTYIDLVNKNIEKWINKNTNNLQCNQLKIINCYEVTEFNNSIREILDSHDKVLNTSGEKDIQDFFEGYQIEKMA